MKSQPKSVTIALRAIWASVGLGVFSFFASRLFDLELLVSTVSSNGWNDNPLAFTVLTSFLGAFVGLSIVAFIAAMISARRNWARVLYLWIVTIGLLLMFFPLVGPNGVSFGAWLDFQTTVHGDLAPIALVVNTGLQVLAFSMLLTKSAKDWFKNVNVAPTEPNEFIGSRSSDENCTRAAHPNSIHAVTGQNTIQRSEQKRTATEVVSDGTEVGDNDHAQTEFNLYDYPQAKMAIEYRPDAEAAWKSIQNYPDRHKVEFLSELNSNPKQDAGKLVAKIREQRNNDLNPFDDPCLNEIFQRLSSVHVEAGVEFKQAVELLGEAVDFEELEFRVGRKFGVQYGTLPPTQEEADALKRVVRQDPKFTHIKVNEYGVIRNFQYALTDERCWFGVRGGNSLVRQTSQLENLVNLKGESRAKPIVIWSKQFTK